jgi:hypothetical protein
MSSYQFTPQAVADLFDIWSFIAQDNPTAADRVEESFGLVIFLPNRLSRDESGKSSLLSLSASGSCSRIQTT